MSTVLDLYAGAGGWDEGMSRIGIHDVLGIEIEPNACATAEAAGHKRLMADVTALAPGEFGPVEGLVASPPCQAFSAAGKGAGRTELARIHALIKAYAAGSDDPGTDWADERSHHVAQPVRWIRDLRPDWIALEQVPPVLPVWKWIAHVLRSWGYSVWTGTLNAADYGVPQTRRRAFLLASRTWTAAPPEPTHADSRRLPDSDPLFGEPLQPWMSMAEALGWIEADHVARTVAGSCATSWTLRGNQKPPHLNGEYAASDAAGPAQTITNQVRSFGWVRTEQTTDLAVGREPVEREVDRPAPTVVTNADRWELRNNSGVNAAVRSYDQPAPTIAFGHAGMQVRLRNDNQANACERLAGVEPAGTLFFGGRQNEVTWEFERPATTVQGDPRIGRPGHKGREAGESQFEVESRRITVTEAAVLQTFSADYPWQGSKTAQFQQVGNAVPPLLAAHVVARVTGIWHGPLS